jgi:hypothetical protein
MIDPTTDRLVRLADVPKIQWLPLRRAGRRLHLATIYRWAQRGLRGVRLEIVQAGGTRCTSEAALLRFFEALSEPRSTQTPSIAKSVAFRQAEAELDRAGI